MTSGGLRWSIPTATSADLILGTLRQALDATPTARRRRTSVSDSDLYKIVLGATLEVNPFKKLSAGEIRRLCIENHERLEKIREFFSGGPYRRGRQGVWAAPGPDRAGR